MKLKFATDLQYGKSSSHAQSGDRTLLSMGALCSSATLFEGLHLQFFNSKLLAT